MIGRIFKIESLATNDGVGLRSVIFLAGCPLRCVYCHNPESWCGDIGIANSFCTTTDELVAKIMRFKPYYGVDGGVTLSGGEPLLQGEFVVELIEKLHQQNINVALDTAGSIIDKFTSKIIEKIDHVILDLKFANLEDYKKYCSGSFETVKIFLKMCEGKRLWIRTVIVPGINDEKEHIQEYINLIKELQRIGKFQIEKYELLPFHTLGFEKYEKLAIDNKLKNIPAMDRQKVIELQKVIDSQIKKQLTSK